MLVAVFEDGVEANLRPLTLARPAYTLRCGASQIYEKILASGISSRLIFFVRDGLLEAARERLGGVGEVYPLNGIEVLRRSGDDLLLVNGRWLFDEKLLRLEDGVAVKDGKPVYAFVGKGDVGEVLGGCGDLSEALDAIGRELGVWELRDARLLNYPWDLIRYNRLELERDLERLRRSRSWGSVSGDARGIHVVGDKEDVMVSERARIYPCVVLDSSEGAIVVEDDAVIFPHSYIRGPCYVGRGSWIVGGRIECSSIGPVCRVGGEVEESIFQGFSNKYHSGFLGHSYIGEWVNLGALTTTSDLRNDYGPVKVPVGGRLVETGMLKVGAFIGDHTKTGIGSLFPTGSVVGIMCNLVTSGEPYPKYIPSFTWYVKGQVRDWVGVERMIGAAERMMARRGVAMSEAEKGLYRRLYRETEDERRRFSESVLSGRYGYSGAKG